MISTVLLWTINLIRKRIMTKIRIKKPRNVNLLHFSFLELEQEFEEVYAALIEKIKNLAELAL